MAILIPESDTTAGEDALGNAIDFTRTNGEVINIFEDGDEYALLPDDASLETIRSLTMAIWNDGGTKDILQAAGGTSFVDIASDVLQTDQSGGTLYVNGAAGTALSAGWNIVGITFAAAKDLSAAKISARAGKLLAYDPKALTAAEHLRNYNAQKSKYGL